MFEVIPLNAARTVEPGVYTKGWYAERRDQMRAAEDIVSVAERIAGKQRERANVPLRQEFDASEIIDAFENEASLLRDAASKVMNLGQQVMAATPYNVLMLVQRQVDELQRQHVLVVEAERRITALKKKYAP